MDSVFASTELHGEAYLIVNGGLVEDMGCAFTSLTGYSKADFTNKKISEVMHRLFGFDLDLGNRTVSENFLFKKSHETIEVRITVYKIGKGSQKLYLFKQKTNFLLNFESSLVDKILKDNFLGVGLYSCPDFRLLKANRKYQEYIKGAWQMESNPLSLCLNEIIPGFNGSKTEALWRNAYESGETVCLKEQKTVSEEGDLRYWNESITPVSEDNRVKYIVMILDDVTENTLKRKYMEEKNEELNKAIEMKDEMLMLISHEMKTPLSIITSSIQTVEIICKNELTDKVKKYLNKIKQNSYRQLKLVNNILDNTRLDSGIFKMNKVSVDIVLLTGTIIDSISVFAERKGVKISFESTLKQSVMQTDVDIYERILLNLLSNAVKFTPEGKSIEVSIFQILMKGRPQVCIQVKDNGIGIPSDQKDLIFERFGRVNRIVTRQSEGTGIGLYLVKMLVSLLDGEITLDSKEGVGSTFSLVFPLNNAGKAPAKPARIDSASEQLVTASAIEFSDIYFGA